MTTTTLEVPAGIATGLPEIGCYFACLASYNSGRLHGAWIDLELATLPEEIQECIDWVLATSPTPGAEEWAMHDHAGLPGYLSGTEWPSIEDLATWAGAVADLSDTDELEAFRLACEDQGETLTDDAFRETYQGCHSSGEDYASQLAEDTGTLPDPAPWPLSCIDWAAAWRELTFDGYRSEPCSSGGVHIFLSC